MKDMMSQVKNFNKIALCVLFLLAAGCQPQEPVNPFVDPGNTPDPGWVVTAPNDMTASMTAIVKVSFTSQPGTLAAFIGEDCCGIGEYSRDYGIYWLYISPADQEQTANDIQLRFYSPDLKRIFVATTTIPFSNDTHLGTLAAPLTPEWTAE